MEQLQYFTHLDRSTLLVQGTHGWSDNLFRVGQGVLSQHFCFWNCFLDVVLLFRAARTKKFPRVVLGSDVEKFTESLIFIIAKWTSVDRTTLMISPLLKGSLGFGDVTAVYRCEFMSLLY